MNFQVQIHVSFTRIAEAMRKLGGSLRKDSAEAIHEKIQQIKDLEIHLVERHASTFTSSSEGRGRLAEDVRKTYSHQRRRRILWELRVLTRNLLSRRAVILRQFEFEVVEFALNGT